MWIMSSKLQKKIVMSFIYIYRKKLRSKKLEFARF